MSDYYRNDKLGKHFHFLKQSTIDNHLQDLINIHNSICFILSQYPNFDGLDFYDVSAGGIQVRLFHKEVTGYCYFSITVKYNFSNKQEVIENAIETWKELDTDEHLKSYQSLLEFGNKYGWD